MEIEQSLMERRGAGKEFEHLLTKKRKMTPAKENQSLGHEKR